MSRSICKKHKNRKLEFACLDSLCKKSKLLCVLCVKSKHKQCKSELLIKLNEDNTSQQKINFSFNPNVFKELKNQSITLFESFFTEVKELKQNEDHKKNNVVIDKQSVVKNPEKEKYNYYYDEKNKKILVVEKDIQLVQDTEMFAKVYKNNIQKFLKKTFENFKMIRFQDQGNQLNLEHLTLHQNLKLEKQAQGFKLGLPTSSNQYYLAIYNKPIKKNLKLELEVDNLNPSDRYCEVGFMTQQQYDQYKCSLRGKYLLGKYCFCGYQKKGMEGQFQQLNLSNPDGLQNKGIIKFEHDYLKSNLTIQYQGQKETNIFASVDTKTKNFYLYICLYFKDQIVTVRYKQIDQLIFFQFFTQQYLFLNE